MQTYPQVLVVVMKRFIIGDNYIMKKLNLTIPAPMKLDLTNQKAQGLQENEVLLPETG